MPETGAESFEILGEAGLLPTSLAKAPAWMVGFRDILVHDDARVDPAIVIRVLRSDLSDVERFREAVQPLI